MLVSERVAAAVTWEVWGSAPGPGHAGLLKAVSGVGMLRMLGGTVGGKGVGGAWVGGFGGEDRKSVGCHSGWVPG